jgi:hypothetical protein
MLNVATLTMRRLMHMRDYISWTTMISAQAQIEGPFGYLKAIHLFKDAQNNRIKVDGW